MDYPDCTYCGARGECRDHVIPRSYKRNTGKPHWRDDWTVPACSLCNNTLGALMLLTVPARARYLHKRYQSARYAKRFDKAELTRRLRHLSRVSGMPDDYMTNGRSALMDTDLGPAPEPTPEHTKPLPKPMPEPVSYTAYDLTPPPMRPGPRRKPRLPPVPTPEPQWWYTNGYGWHYGAEPFSLV